MTYQPIENYGIVGDLHTIALVGLNGSIDFLCFPNFDSPSIFASLVDCNKGGFFCIRPMLKDVKNKQVYLPDTNVLLTRFLSAEGVSEITDFMPVAELGKCNTLIRRVTNIRGEAHHEMICSPRFDYARSGHDAYVDGDSIVFVEKEKRLSIRLRSNVPIEIRDNDAYANFTLGISETAEFILELVREEGNDSPPIKELVDQELYKTIEYWRKWVESSNYRGRWMDIVNRSALVLKLFTSHKYGSVVAAPTFGLPEHIGGTRNWDYRYTWIRDSAFIVYALMKLGYSKEAGSFMNWLEKQCSDIGHAGYLGLVYALDGRKELEELPLPHLEGYMGSQPVRIGNDAYRQIQLDIYGEMMDAVYLYNKYGEPISYDLWMKLSNQLNWLENNWRLEDEGVWEVRGGRQHFLFSRLMSWVAFDRAIKIATSRSFPYPERWKAERDIIFRSIFREFWNEERQCFVQYAGASTVDAAMLLMPLVGFISPKDPRWLSTLKAIEEDLVSDSLIYRYRHQDAAYDGFNVGEGTFTMCTFWYVECLARSGQLKKARLIFEKMLGFANHLGLYAEQLGFHGEHLGNFPQAFSHTALISAAFNLEKRLSDERNKDNDFYNQLF